MFLFEFACIVFARVCVGITIISRNFASTHNRRYKHEHCTKWTVNSKHWRITGRARANVQCTAPWTRILQRAACARDTRYLYVVWSRDAQNFNFARAVAKLNIPHQLWVSWRGAGNFGATWHTPGKVNPSRRSRMQNWFEKYALLTLRQTSAQRW